jgi:hypothetical protein
MCSTHEHTSLRATWPARPGLDRWYVWPEWTASRKLDLRQTTSLYARSNGPRQNYTLML